jgi:hypothetical protein
MMRDRQYLYSSLQAASRADVPLLPVHLCAFCSRSAVLTCQRTSAEREATKASIPIQIARADLVRALAVTGPPA